jgi:hypothetical protein
MCRHDVTTDVDTDVNTDGVACPTEDPEYSPAWGLGPD